MPSSAADPDGPVGLRRGLVLTGLALAAGVLLAWPMVRLAAEAGSDGGAAVAAALAPPALVAIANSLWTSLAVTIGAVALALALAMLVEHAQVRTRRALLACLVGPLLVPDFVTAVAWGRAYGPAGLLDRVSGVELPGLYGPAGVVVVLAAGSVPLALLIVIAGMRASGEPDLVRAARVHGASPLAAFRTISLPLLWPVLLAAAGLVFASTVNAFGTPAVLGRPAGFATMTTRIYGDLAFSADPTSFQRALGLSLVLIALVVGALALADRLLPRPGRVLASIGPRAALRPAPVPAVAAAWSFVALTTAVPLAALVLQALTRAVGLPPLPEHLTLDNFGRAVDSRTLPAVFNSLLLAGAAAVVCVGLGLAAALAPPRRWRRWAASTVAIGFAVPGSVLAIAVLLAYGAPLRDTLWLIGIAYVAKLWALAERPIAAAHERRSPLAARAARVHGAGPATALRTIVLPLLAPVIVAAGLLVFVFALHEVTISILLYGPTSATLSVAILNLQQLGDPTVTAALALLLTGLVGVACLPLLALRRAWGGSAG